LDLLERAYAAYTADPEAPGKRFAALRSLLRVCRLHDISGPHAAMFAELGRVDDEAPAVWQLVLQRRKPTRPQREKQKQDKVRRTKSLSSARRWRRFGAVMDKLAVGDMSLQEACTAVAAEEGKNVDWPAVRADYLAIAGQYRRAGLDAAEFGNDDAIRRIALPRRGRPPKKSKSPEQ
jgi:hypothetical protein